MKTLAFIIYIISILPTIEGNIRKFPEGNTLLDEFGSGVVKILAWRARANIRQELKGLYRFLGIFLIIVFSTLAISGKSVSMFSNSWILWAIILLIMIWQSFNWVYEFKRQLKEWIMFGLFIVVVPWVVIYVPQLLPVRTQLHAAFFPVLNLFGVSQINPFIAASVASLFLLFGVIFTFLIYSAFYFAIVYFVYFVFWIISQLSHNWLANQPRWIYHFMTVYFYIGTVYLAWISVFP